LAFFPRGGRRYLIPGGPAELEYFAAFRGSLFLSHSRVTVLLAVVLLLFGYALILPFFQSPLNPPMTWFGQE